MSVDDESEVNENGDIPTGEEMSYPSVEEMDALLADYQITEIIGQGGMGVVYCGWQERLERYVAIKVLPKIEDNNETFATQFKSEARTMAALHHSHIATVYDFGVVEGLHYLVMEHVDGGTLYEHFYGGAYTPAEVISIVLQVCDGLSYAHSSNVNHRDIKSANILIGQDGMSKLVDFGLATLQEAPGVLRKRSAAEVNYGTPGYSAPELFSIGAHVDHRADIYSTAVVVYEGLTGKTLDEPWTSPSAVSGAPSGIDQVIRKATKKDPKARYQSIDLFANALRNLKHTGAATVPTARTVNVVTSAAAGAAPARVVAVKQQSAGPVIAVFAILAVIGVIALMALSGGDDKKLVTAKNPEELLSTVGKEKEPVETPTWEPVEPVEPVPATPEVDDPEPKVDVPEINVVLPTGVTDAEAALAAEMGELDGMFSDAYQKLTEKYLVALDRLRAGAPASGLVAIEADAASVKNGDPPPERDAADLYPPLAKLRPVLRAEHGKLVSPISQARIEVLEPHLEKLNGIRAGLSDGTVGARVDALIDGHQAKMAELRLALESPESSRGTPAVAPAAAIDVGYEFMQRGEEGSATIAPRGKGIGIFAGLLGEISRADATVFVPPASLDGNWELYRAGSSSFLHGRALFYENPRFDFSKTSFETYEWTKKSPNKRLIDADQGFAMISGVAGRIGSSTNFAINYDDKIDHWYCDGRASNATTTVIVTQVRVPGGLWLKVKRNLFQWRVGEPKLKMIHKDDGFCVLTGIRGPFNGGGENLKLSIDKDDGFWYISGASGVGGVSAQVTAFTFPKD